MCLSVLQEFELRVKPNGRSLGMGTCRSLGSTGESGAFLMGNGSATADLQGVDSRGFPHFGGGYWGPKHGGEADLQETKNFDRPRCGDNDPLASKLHSP